MIPKYTTLILYILNKFRCSAVLACHWYTHSVNILNICRNLSDWLWWAKFYRTREIFNSYWEWILLYYIIEWRDNLHKKASCLQNWFHLELYYYVTDTALNEKLTNKVHLLITWKKKLNGMIYKVSLRGQGRGGGVMAMLRLY